MDTQSFKRIISRVCACGHQWTEHKVVDENKLICLACPLNSHGHHVTCETIYLTVIHKRRHKLGKPL